MRASAVCSALLLVGTTGAHAATEDMDFIAEHLPEAAMDNRLLSLPLDFADNLPREEWSADLGALAERIESGNARLSGPGVGLGLRRQVSRSWAVLGAAFFDHLAFSGDTEARPVAPIFSTSFPISLPANAVLGNQRGNVDLRGLGVAMRYQPDAQRYAFTLGALRQSAKLDGYRVDYRLVDGPSAGTSGTLDYSTDYSFWVPFATFEWRITHADWQFAPRFSAAVPVPQRGWRGRITGPGFDVAGDTDAIGRGKHMGDPFAGLGFGITYRPWNITMDAGASLNQLLLEPRIHDGVDRAWLLNFDWTP